MYVAPCPCCCHVRPCAWLILTRLPPWAGWVQYDATYIVVMQVEKKVSKEKQGHHL